MDKLKVGVFIENSASNGVGGGFSYQMKLLEILDSYEFDISLEIIYVSFQEILGITLKRDVLEMPMNEFIKSYPINWYSILRNLFSLPLLKYLNFVSRFSNRIEIKRKIFIEKYLLINNVDIIYYLTPTYNTINFPFIMTHWDLGHKTLFAFPEVSMNGSYENREYYHRIVLGKAFAIFVESQSSKKELIYYENLNPDKIFVVPLIPGNVIDVIVSKERQEEILSQWNVKKHKFFFYPAQFWSHKNHYNLVKAFKLFVENQPKIKLLLTGSDKGNLKYIEKLVRENHLQEHVIFTGIVDNEEMFTFYKNAISLVMPTFLGPTNMPLLEAYHLGCPVICSKLKGHVEQLGNYALYFDPASHVEINDKMLQVVNKESTFKSNVRSLSNIGEVLNDYFLTIAKRRKIFGQEFSQY